MLLVLLSLLSLFVFFWSPQTLKALIFLESLKSHEITAGKLPITIKALPEGWVKRLWQTRSHMKQQKRLFHDIERVFPYTLTVFCHIISPFFVWKTNKKWWDFLVGEIVTPKLPSHQGWWCQWRRLCSPWWILILNASGLPTFWRRFWCRQGSRLGFFWALESRFLRFLHRIDPPVPKKWRWGLRRSTLLVGFLT